MEFYMHISYLVCASQKMAFGFQKENSRGSNQREGDPVTQHMPFITEITIYISRFLSYSIGCKSVTKANSHLRELRELDFPFW